MSDLVTCGLSWQPRTADEMTQIGRQHDDSPWSRHVVSCSPSWEAGQMQLLAEEVTQTRNPGTEEPA